MNELSFDSGDLKFGEMMAETDGFVEALAAFEFEGNTLRSTVLFDDFGSHTGSFDSWSANFGVGAVVDEENFAKFDGIVRIDRKAINADGITFLDAVLFSASFENCVGHGYKFGLS